MPKITAEMADGTTHDPVVPPKSFMCLADRVAFERHFGTSIATVMATATARNADRDQSDEDDEAGGPDTIRLGDMREEHLAFFAWRTVSRHGDLATFDEFVDQVLDVTIDASVDDTDDEDDTTGPTEGE